MAEEQKSADYPMMVYRKIDDRVEQVIVTDAEELANKLKEGFQKAADFFGFGKLAKIDKKQ